MIMITAFPILFDRIIVEKICHSIYDLTTNHYFTKFVRDLTRVIIPNVLTIDYSFLFVLMGVLWYYINNKYFNSIVLLGFSLFSFLFRENSFNYLGTFFIGSQYMMALAIPIILMYNGEKGKSHKLFFYAYYPVHYIIICYLGQILL